MFKRIFAIAFIANVLLVAVLSTLYIRDITHRETDSLVSAARTLARNASSTRNEMANLIESKIIDFDAIVASGRQDRILKAVPIIAAIEFAQKTAGDQGLQFKTPKFQARNPKNEANEYETGILNSFLKDSSKNEHIDISVSKGTLDYYMPISLSLDCLVCHGDPKGQSDPLGYAKEGWKAGQIVAAFRIMGDLKPAQNRQLQVTLTIIGLSIIMLGLSGFATFLLVKSITKPIATYVSIMDSASKGNLMTKAEFTGNDEIGKIGSYFNEFLLSLRQVIVQTKQKANVSKEKGVSLERRAHDISDAGTGIQTNVHNLDRQMKQLDSAISSTTNSARALSQFLNDLKSLIMDQTNAVSSSSSAVEEIVASIHNIAKTAEDKIELSKRLESEASEGIQHLSETMGLINQTADSTRDILDMTAVIQKIAAQTNLLAMNAAIEAAHAGKAGAGFAVVADEIRKLSEHAGSSAKRISQTVKKIHSFTDKTRSASESTVERFNKISVSITSVAQSMLELQQSTKELSEGSNLILQQNINLQENGNTIRTSSATMSERIAGIMMSIQQLEEVSQTSRQQFIELEQAVRKLAEMSSAINTLGDENRNSMSQLIESLNIFITSNNKDS